MTPQFYLFLHISGVIILFLALGALIVSSKAPKGAIIAHGVALLLLLVSGFGRMAKMKYAFDTWLFIKLAIWLLLGVSLVVLKRGLLPAKVASVLIAILGIAAAWSALFLDKPGVAAAE